MTVVPFVHEGLGNSSYLVELGEKKAALIDPDRNVRRYLQAAESRGWDIDAVFETHLHADFVSGAREAANATGARIFAPQAGTYRFPIEPMKAGDRMRFGGVELEAIGSPGHTPEHLSYVVRGAGRPDQLFSGGSLIVGGAARTDLIAPDQTTSLTRSQYRTLTQAFEALADETLLYPTHGGGSFCSTGAGAERTSTLGKERATNPLLDRDDEDEFVRWFPTSFPAVPAYFSRMRPINQGGPRFRSEIAMPPALSPDDFERARDGALVVDVRPFESYAEAHVDGALSIAFRDVYATWLGWLVPADTKLLFVTGDERLEDVIDQSLLVGYEDFAGWLDGGMDAWTAAGKSVSTSTVVDAAEARSVLSNGAVAVDVREPGELASGTIPGAVTIPLGALAGHELDRPNGQPVVVYCGHGERAASAASVLERAGFTSVSNLRDGIGAWRKAEYPIETAGAPA